MPQWREIDEVRFSPDLIHLGVTGFLRHRQIQDNIRRTSHAMHETKINTLNTKSILFIFTFFFLAIEMIGK